MFLPSVFKAEYACWKKRKGVYPLKAKQKKFRISSWECEDLNSLIYASYRGFNECCNEYVWNTDQLNNPINQLQRNFDWAPFKRWAGIKETKEQYLFMFWLYI